MENQTENMLSNITEIHATYFRDLQEVHENVMKNHMDFLFIFLQQIILILEFHFPHTF